MFIIKYCKNCRQNVTPSKKFSFGWFIVNCLWLIGGVIYIIYYFGKTKVCPKCGSHNFEHKHSTEELKSINGNIQISKDDYYTNMVVRMKNEGKAEKKANKTI